MQEIMEVQELQNATFGKVLLALLLCEWKMTAWNKRENFRLDHAHILHTLNEGD